MYTHTKDHMRTLMILRSMSESGGLWKHQNNPAPSKSVRVFVMLDTIRKAKGRQTDRQTQSKTKTELQRERGGGGGGGEGVFKTSSLRHNGTMMMVLWGLMSSDNKDICLYTTERVGEGRRERERRGNACTSEST